MPIDRTSELFITSNLELNEQLGQTQSYIAEIPDYEIPYNPRTVDRILRNSKGLMEYLGSTSLNNVILSELIEYYTEINKMVKGYGASAQDDATIYRVIATHYFNPDNVRSQLQKPTHAVSQDIDLICGRSFSVRNKFQFFFERAASHLGKVSYAITENE